MAFRSKLGSLITPRTLESSSLSNGSATMLHLLNSVRYMSSKLFVGGLSYGTDDHSLKSAFDSFGNVTEARVITDRDTGRSRGFGFVSFDEDDAASSAMSQMDGQALDGRNIRVNLANERPAGGGFRGNSDGGYGGGGYGGGAY